MKAKSHVRNGRKRKFLVAVVAATAMVIGLSVTAFADSSVTKYATPDELLDPEIFGLYEQGDAELYFGAQKVEFGLRNGTDPQKWYIAGKDAEDTLVLVCDPTNPLYEDFNFGDPVYKDSAAKQALDGEFEGELFTDGQRQLIKETSVKTKNPVTEEDYFTPCRLYLAKGDSNYICVGENDNIKIGLKNTNAPSNSPYSKEGNGSFWLRGCDSAPHETAAKAYYAEPGGAVGVDDPEQGQKNVVPAININTSDVLFASVAPAATDFGGYLENEGEDDDYDCFILRMNAEESAVGRIGSTASYDSQTIRVTKQTDDGELYLYVQGLCDEKDWAWSTQVTGDKEYTLVDFEKDIDLKEFAVWLEYKDTDSNLVYAKRATQATCIENASMSASYTPPYNGEVISADKFGIVCELAEGVPLDPSGYELKYYSDASCSAQVEPINAGEYYVVASGIESKGYTGTTDAMTVKVFKAILPRPEAVKGLVADGTVKTGIRLPDGADANLYVIENGANAEAGTYEATITLSDSENYCWTGEDADPENKESSKPIKIEWVIEPKKAEPTPTPDPKPLPFGDVPKGKWYYDAVNFVYQNGIMVGKSTDKFDPLADITRQEFVTILYNYMGKPAVSGEFKQFKDVPAGKWFSKPVQWGYENKILLGKSDNEFGLGNVTRQEAAKFLYNLAVSQQIKLDKKADLGKFKDANKIGKWAKESVSYMVGHEVMSGKGNGILDPTANLSRAEAAQLIKRFVETFRKDS